MYQDTDKIAEALWDKRGRAVEVDPAQFEEMLRRAEPGWDPFDFPENYRWFLIKDFPVKDLDVTLERLMKDARDPGQEKFQHDRIIELWKKGRPFWPVFVTATGIIADGYHRTAAHRTLGHKTVDVVVSVAKREAYPLYQDELWLEEFPARKKYLVYAGSQDRTLSLKNRPMYGSENFDIALSYAKNRYASDETYVHRLIFNIKKAATPEDVESAIAASGHSYESEGWFSQGDSLRDPVVRGILEGRGFDGAVGVWDFGFDSFEEVPVIVVFDAQKQVEIPDPEPFVVHRR